MKYCSSCGAQVTVKVPPGDSMARHVCDSCHMIHYQNPKIVAGCVVECDARVLLCRRAIEPRFGLWTVPAGFMENGETLEQAALRETQEEACAEPTLTGLYGVYNIPYVNQVYVMFRARLDAPVFSPGAESLEVELFSEDQVPWDELAFRVVRATLERYYRDRAHGHFPPYIDEIRR